MTPDPAATARVDAALGEVRVRYSPYEPTMKQELFMLLDQLEVFFGGAAGPGKSWGLLMAALQYVDIPGYHALLLRPSLTEFEQKGGLIEAAHEWLDTSDAYWHGTKREWTFPSGATLRFGYLSSQGDIGQYKGAAYSFVGFDELTSWPNDRLYRMMFRVLRQRKDALPGVPLRMRSASNPGDIGHSWVKYRFIDPATKEKDALFVKARITDNPYLDYEAYLQSLAHLMPVDRMRLINGDWDVEEEGGVFERAKLEVVKLDAVLPPVKVVRYWDLAATEPSSTNADPDYTVGVRMELDAHGKFTVRGDQIVRGQWAEADVEARMLAAAREDGIYVPIKIEQEPGASGKNLIAHYTRTTLQGFDVSAGLTRGKAKEVRARPWASAVANGNAQITPGVHVNDFLDEHAIFPGGAHDDCVDAASGAHTFIADAPIRRMPASPARIQVPVGRR